MSCYHATVLLSCKIDIDGIHSKNEIEKWLNEGFNIETAHFFFVTWFHWVVWKFLMVSPIFWHENLKPWWFHVIRKSNKLKPQVSAPALGGFTKLENKINWNQRFRLLPDLPPPPRSGGLSACRLPPRSGARQIRQEPNTSGFNFFYFRVSWIPPKAGAEYLRFQFFNFRVTWNTTQGFQVFHVKILVNTIKNFQTTQWNPGHKIKKICAVFIEITHWRFFDKNTAVTFFCSSTCWTVQN